MLEEGLIVSAMGMGTVLSFLIILIFAMVVMYKILLFILLLGKYIVFEGMSRLKILSKENLIWGGVYTAIDIPFFLYKSL